MEMNKSWLIQRLCEPYKSDKFDINPFAFGGGGLKNGGLTKEALDLTKSVFTFDYMGCAEFEWGEVPKALSTIFENREKLAYGATKVKASYQDWRKDKKVYLKKEADVYYICQKEHEEEVIKRIHDFAKGINSKQRVKEIPMLDSSIFAEELNRAIRITGWLELNNGYMFFISREMFEGSCKLFGVEVKIVV